MQHKRTKPAQAVRLAHWLSDLAGPVIFAGDFNTPKIDHPDHDQLHTHWRSGRKILDGAPGDDLLVGPNEIHDLRDALRVWSDAHPETLARVRAARSDGPLAVSNMPGPKVSRLQYRYDAIWISPHFDVHGVSYHYDEAVETGTDHALVIADLTMPTT